MQRSKSLARLGALLRRAALSGGEASATAANSASGIAGPVAGRRLLSTAPFRSEFLRGE